MCLCICSPVMYGVFWFRLLNLLFSWKIGMYSQKICQCQDLLKLFAKENVLKHYSAILALSSYKVENKEIASWICNHFYMTILFLVLTALVLKEYTLLINKLFSLDRWWKRQTSNWTCAWASILDECCVECWACASGSTMSGPMTSHSLTTWRLEANQGKWHMTLF